MPSIVVTGGNRGIGLALVKSYATKGYNVISAVRDPSSMPSMKNVIALKFDQGILSGASELANALKQHGFQTIDKVVVNAGILGSAANMTDVDMDDYERTWQVNVRGPLLLWQQLNPLLAKGTLFAVISSAVGQMQSDLHSFGAASAYAQSKAAVNFFVSRIAAEQPQYVFLAVNPGWLQTDMGNAFAKGLGRESAPQSVDDIIKDLMKTLENVTSEQSGTLVNWDGSKMDF